MTDDEQGRIRGCGDIAKRMREFNRDKDQNVQPDNNALYDSESEFVLYQKTFKPLFYDIQSNPKVRYQLF